MNMLPLRLTSLLLLLLLGGCSTVSGWFSLDDEDGNNPAELEDYKPTVNIKKLWSADIGSGQGDAYHSLYPAIADDVIYAAGSDGSVLALNRNNGRRIWKRDYDVPISGGVGYGAQIEGRRRQATVARRGKRRGDVTASEQRRSGIGAKLQRSPVGPGCKGRQ